MSCPSMLYTVLANATVAENGTAGFGSAVRGYGGAIMLNGTGINQVGGGYFGIDSSLTFTPTATGPVTIQFYLDGSPITGAVATGQGTAAQPLNLSVIGETRNCGRCCNSALTYTISAAGTIDVLSTRTVKG